MNNSRSRAALALLIVFACLIAVACGGENGGQATATARTVTPSVLTATAPAATPSPVPSAGAPRENGYELAPTLPEANFERMLGLAAIPGNPNEAVVLTQGGVIYRVALDGSFSPTVFGDLSGLLIENPGNEEGLLGLAFSPTFEADGRVFVDYSAGNPRRSVLARFNVSNGAMEMGSERVILEVPQPFRQSQRGPACVRPGRLPVLGPRRRRLGGRPAGKRAEAIDAAGSRSCGSTSPATATRCRRTIRSSTWRARSRRSTPTGCATPGASASTGSPAISWAGDVGQDKWEEVDRIESGGNYGWSIMEGFECYQGPDCDQTGLIPPRAAYGHDAGCSITGGYVYRGAAMPELQGWYVYGDYCSGNIWALDTTADGEPVLLAESGHTITSFAELPDGEIVALTFDGGIFRLQRAP